LHPGGTRTPPSQTVDARKGKVTGQREPGAEREASPPRPRRPEGDHADPAWVPMGYRSGNRDAGYKPMAIAAPMATAPSTTNIPQIGSTHRIQSS